MVFLVGKTNVSDEDLKVLILSVLFWDHLLLNCGKVKKSYLLAETFCENFK